MLRAILMAIFLGTGCVGFSEQLLPQALLQSQGDSLVYWGRGYANLLGNEPLRALENFRKSTAALNRPDDWAGAVSFMISFGEIVAYDMLGSRAECKQALGSLLLAASEDDEEDDEEEIADDEEGVEILLALANLAPSPDIRKLLFALLEE